MMKTIALFFFFLVLFSCQSQTDKDLVSYRDTIYLDIKGNQYAFIGQIPDSLRTEEQGTLINRMNEVSIKYISVKNNHMVLDISKEEFVAKGIPERYYHILVQNIRDNNAFFDSMGIKDVDSMIKRRNEAYDRFKQRETDF